jgi:small subunit ribosomal protein S7
MSRKGTAIKREMPPDLKYGSVLVSKFINHIMRKGKKSLAERMLYSALDVVNSKVPQAEPLSVFNQAVENVKPLLEVKSRRVGGANYQVPVEVRPERRASLAIRWIIEGAKSRPEKTMIERLALEIVDAYNKTGRAIKKREDTHRMAEANKAFAHYRW